MAQLFGLSGEQVDGIRPFFPKEQGGKRVDDRKALSGIIPVMQKELPWVDAPAADGPHKILYNRCRRWRDKGVFELIFSELSASDSPEPPDSPESPDVPEPEVLMIDATDIKAHPTASSLNKGGVPRLIGGTKGGMTSKLHGVCHSKGGPLRLHLRRGNAVTSLVLMGCARTCRLRPR